MVIGDNIFGRMTNSYWQIKGGMNVSKLGSADFRKKYDIAVIGGGITGIATAYFLQKFECENVIVLEKNAVGYGASGRNAGFLLAGLSEPYSRLKVGMGDESARELMAATTENHDLIAAAIEENRIDCQYSRSGSYHLATSPVERKECEDTVESLIRDGFKAEIIDNPPGLNAKSDYYKGGYFYPSDGCLNPYMFVKGLSKDIDIVEGFEVESILKSKGSLVISGPGGEVKSEMAVMATNGYSPLLDRYFERLIYPIRGQMTATLPVDIRNLNESIYYANFGYDYFRQSVDNSILMGGLRNRYLSEETGFEDEENPALQKDLEQYIRNNLGISEFGIFARWSGLMAATIDGLPVVGSLPHNSAVIVNAGFNGHGFGLGMIVARDLAAAIVNGESSFILKRFSLRRFL